jgi:hypothetical protein
MIEAKRLTPAPIGPWEILGFELEARCASYTHCRGSELLVVGLRVLVIRSLTLRKLTEVTH